MEGEWKRVTWRREERCVKGLVRLVSLPTGYILNLWKKSYSIFIYHRPPGRTIVISPNSYENTRT